MEATTKTPTWVIATSVVVVTAVVIIAIVLIVVYVGFPTTSSSFAFSFSSSSSASTGTSSSSSACTDIYLPSYPPTCYAVQNAESSPENNALSGIEPILTLKPPNPCFDISQRWTFVQQSRLSCGRALYAIRTNINGMAVVPGFLGFPLVYVPFVNGDSSQAWYVMDVGSSSQNGELFLLYHFRTQQILGVIPSAGINVLMLQSTENPDLLSGNPAFQWTIQPVAFHLGGKCGYNVSCEIADSSTSLVAK